MRKIFILFIFSLFFTTSCSKKEVANTSSPVSLPPKDESPTGTSEQKPNDSKSGEVLLGSNRRETHLTSWGQFLGAAISKSSKAQIVLYPTDLLPKESFYLITNKIETSRKLEILGSLESGTRDEFLLGLMKGRDLKSFIRDRLEGNFKADLQPWGLVYQAKSIGGVLSDFKVTLQDGSEIQDEDYYKTALSNQFYSHRLQFPGYFYGNGLNTKFKLLEAKTIKVSEAVKTFVESESIVDDIEFRKDVVLYEDTIPGDKGVVSIPEIQGKAHRSEMLGFKVITKGIVTALAKNSNYPFGTMTLYIQDKDGDGDDLTSDAVAVFLNEVNENIGLGSLVRVTGRVFEEVSSNRMSTTSLRDVVELTILSQGHELPAAVMLGEGGRSIPRKKISSIVGNLNEVELLNLFDGIDFYESLEGMRVKIKDPVILGSRGGHDSYVSEEAINSCREACDPKDSNCKRKCSQVDSHISFYLRGDGSQAYEEELYTPAGGLMPNHATGDENPEIFMVTSNDFTKGLSSARHIFNAGDLLKGELEGVLTYQKNLFGDGEFVLSLPLPQDIFDGHTRKEITPLSERKKSKLTQAENSLRVASYNVMNLSALAKDRIVDLGIVIKDHLHCPDIITLVEIQDNNGDSFEDGSDATKTLMGIIEVTKCSNGYDFVNINPLNHKEGGQPGGNIRVAMLYNKDRVLFQKRGVDNNPLVETVFDEENNLINNPARVFPSSSAFEGSRKSLISQFEFEKTKIFVIGNHFKSKLGDNPLWGDIQPFFSTTNEVRKEMAEKVIEVSKEIKIKNPDAVVLLAGDFNALMHEESLEMIEKAKFPNLMRLVPENERYTTSHNGNSQPLDYIFIDQNSLVKYQAEFEVLNINSDYMGKMSDHDPVMVKLNF